MKLIKQYEIVEDASKPISWERYENEAISCYRELLKSNSDNEAAFQEFFENNPAMLPGAYGFHGESGHAPFNNVLITKPRLQGISLFVPDFLWISMDSCTISPIFIEIEKPSKNWFTGGGQPTHEFTQAQTQLLNWKTWFQNPVHMKLFIEYYEIPTSLTSMRAIEPYYVLIYGSMEELSSHPNLNKMRKDLQRENEIYMTFGRPKPNQKSHSVITCRKTDKGYEAIKIPPTFKLGPTFAKQLARIRDKKSAIESSYLNDERKKFLIKRIEYWENYGKEEMNGIINTADWE
jgi:hypothetical protein